MLALAIHHPWHRETTTMTMTMIITTTMLMVHAAQIEAARLRDEAREEQQRRIDAQDKSTRKRLQVRVCPCALCWPQVWAPIHYQATKPWPDRSKASGRSWSLSARGTFQHILLSLHPCTLLSCLQLYATEVQGRYSAACAHPNVRA